MMDISILAKIHKQIQYKTNEKGQMDNDSILKFAEEEFGLSKQQYLELNDTHNALAVKGGVVLPDSFKNGGYDLLLLNENSGYLLVFNPKKIIITDQELFSNQI